MACTTEYSEPAAVKGTRRKQSQNPSDRTKGAALCRPIKQTRSDFEAKDTGEVKRSEMAKSKAVANATLVLRILALGLAVASFVVFIVNTVDNGDGTKTTFKDVFGYKYTFATAVIGAAYSLLQLPFAIHRVATAKRLIKGDFMLVFDFFADKLISFLVASGVGAGFAITYELKRLFHGVEQLVGLENFFDKAYISCGLLLGTFVCLALLSVLSSRKPKKLFG